MQPKKLDVLITLFCYGGNGGVATILPDIATWLAKTVAWLHANDRVGRVSVTTAGDIPLAMERNRVVVDAKKEGFDVLIMMDSDNVPDLYLDDDPSAQPFVESSFNFLYERSCQGIPTVVAAPYCGPPVHPTKNPRGENVYVFYATEDGTESDDLGVYVEAYSRDHACLMKGIQPIAAGPTGCIMYSMDAFDLMPVHGKTDEEILNEYKNGEISAKRASQLLRMESWFYYEYIDGYQTHKASTEDVTNTREINIAGALKHNCPIVFCNWDAWAGHYKPKCVGKPNPLRIETVSNLFRDAVNNNIGHADSYMEIDFTKNLLAD